MTEVNSSENKHNQIRSKSAIRVPIALHFYAIEIVAILLVIFIINFYVQSIVKNYIAQECKARIETAVSSTQNFTIAFRTEIDKYPEKNEEVIKDFLLKSIRTADLSNQASIALYTYDAKTNRCLLLWPTSDYNINYANSASGVISQVVEEHGYSNLRDTQTTKINGNLVYYRSVGFQYNTPENQVMELDGYYLLVYVNSGSYYSFMAQITLALVQAALLAIIIAGVLSFILSYPLISSTRRLSRFAGRVAKGDFDPIKGKIRSKELSELGDSMNRMAYKLEEADVEQKTFFQNASHELRTPLMSIQGYAEGLKFGVFEDKESKDNAIDVIIAETERLSGLVENLLSISKMDMSKSGNYEVKKQNLNVKVLCETIIDRVRGNFIHADKAIINRIKADSLYIYANENDMIRCLENIFSNCLRYCRSAVTFDCRPDRYRKKIIFTISDDGPGISQEVLDHLFERFTKGSDGKHGIGLALAKAIANEHGGDINAFNKVDGGACFEITIPLVKRRDQLTKLNNLRNLGN
ncbi:MAG: HAMP domain-containing histidine kinase [Clostridiales bacterium]|nr:HAMP domain-containing histidine kinase [Clostridiales bacterium]